MIPLIIFVFGEFSSPVYAQLCLSTLHQHVSVFVKYFKHSMLPHPQSIVKTGTWLQIACLSERAPAEKLSLSQPNRQSKLEMFQQEVEELFFFQTGAFIVTYVTSWWEVIGCLQVPEPRCNL